MKLLAFCPNCTKIILSDHVVEPGTVINITHEQCHRCGHTAETGYYINDTMYIADHKFRTTSDAETLDNVLQILQV